MRNAFHEMESSYLEKKSVYENTALGLEAETEKLSSEVSAFETDCMREESAFFTHHAELLITQSMLKRAEKESSGGFTDDRGRPRLSDGESPGVFKTYR